MALVFLCACHFFLSKMFSLFRYDNCHKTSPIIFTVTEQTFISARTWCHFLSFVLMGNDSFNFGRVPSAPLKKPFTVKKLFSQKKGMRSRPGRFFWIIFLVSGVRSATMRCLKHQKYGQVLIENMERSPRSPIEYSLNKTTT